MALNASGPISLGGSTTGVAIAAELALSPTAQISLNDTVVRTLAAVPSGQISMPIDFWGKSAGAPAWNAGINVNTLSTENGNFARSMGVSSDSGNTIVVTSITPFAPPAGTIPLGNNYPIVTVLNSTTGALVRAFKQATTSTPSNSAATAFAGTDAIYYANTYGPPGVLLTKFNLSYVEQYSRLIGPTGTASAVNLSSGGGSVDSSGNVYLSGSRNTVDDAFLSKINSSGTHLWCRSWGNGVGTSPDTSASSAAIDNSTGTVYTLNSSPFTSNPAPAPGGRASITVHNSSGVLQATWGYWNATVNAQLVTAYGTQIQISKTGNLLLLQSQESGAPTRKFLTSLNKTTGAPLWTRTITYSSTFGFTPSLLFTTDLSDNIYAIFISDVSSAQFYVLKFNSSGVIQWQRKVTKAGTSLKAQIFQALPGNYGSFVLQDSPRILTFGFSEVTGAGTKAKIVSISETDILANKVFSDGLTFSTSTDISDANTVVISSNTTSFPTEYGGTVSSTAGPSMTDITSSLSVAIST